MTESKTWTEENVPASDVWGIAKSMGAMMPEEERAEDRLTRPEGALLGPREERGSGP